MAIRIGHACMDENKKASGGKAGDQTGNEIKIQNWYNNNWNVMLICKDKTIASKAAKFMTEICNNNNFGYDQSQRITGYNNIVAAGNNVSRALPGEFDCSSLVSSCYKLAGVNVNPSCTTRNMRQAFINTGLFECYTDAAHTTTADYAEVGAIYLKEGTHVCMALDAAPVKEVPFDATTTEKTIWKFFKSNGFTDIAIAGLMGNLYAESGLRANNLQQTYEKSLGLTDAQYTAKVDNGSYTNFVHDKAGYGLSQWTYWSRKEGLQKFANSQKKSIGDLNMQLEYLLKELKSSYPTQYKKLQAATTVLEASNIILKEFEKPANQSEAVQKKRADYGQGYYDKYAEKSSSSKTPVATNTKQYAYAQKLDKQYDKQYTTTATLNLRYGPSTSYDIVTTMPKGSKFRCYGYYTLTSGIQWLWGVYNGNIKGFCSIKYLS